MELLLIYKRRNSLKIIENILIAALDGARITHIVYKANLNFVRCRKYLNFMSKQGLIAVESKPGKSRCYRTTDKGKKLLKCLRNASELI